MDAKCPSPVGKTGRAYHGVTPVTSRERVDSVEIAESRGC
jgi:hypothetical protein